MKKIFILLIICFCASMAKAETFFEECENIPGVTTVYVSKAMISLAGDLNIDSDNMDFNSIASKIDGLWVVNAENDKARIIKDKAKNLFNGKDYEKLVSVREDDETVDILMRSLGKGKNECIIKALESDEATIVIITGSFTLLDIASATRTSR